MQTRRQAAPGPSHRRRRGPTTNRLAGFDLKYVAPKTAWITPEPIAIIAGAPHPKAARAFIEFMLTEKGQKVAMERGVFPITPKYRVQGAPGSTAEMAVEFTGGLHLDGRIEGAISADGMDAVLTLSDKGRVVGEIRASNAVINGMVQGDIVVAERLELAAGARIEGNVYYKVLEMAAGAQINGKMVYQPDVPRQLPRPEMATAEA